MNLYFFRHGETEYNKVRKYASWLDISITEEGEKQAGRTAKAVKKVDFKAVYASDLKRTMETAAILFKGRKLEIIQMQWLRELNTGKWTGFSYDQILKKDKDYFDKLYTDPFSLRTPGGESFREFLGRVTKALKIILASHEEGDIAIVSHLGPIRIMISRLIGLSPKKIMAIYQDPGTYSKVARISGRNILQELNIRS